MNKVLEHNSKEVILKGQFPFRLGTTSYIIPANILANVEYLADKVDDIELVLFESDEISNIPDAKTVRRLIGLAEKNNLTYTVHLPLDAYLGSGDENIRTESVKKCLKIIERMNAVNPFSYVIHFHGDRRGNSPSGDMKRWVDLHRKSVRELLRHISPSKLAVETLDYPYELIESIVREYDLATCMDIGHISLCEHPLERYLKWYLHRTNVIHLHGVCNQKDHVDISHIAKPLLRQLMTKFCESAGDRKRVLTLEIFSKKDFLTSLDVLKEFMEWEKLF